jgi:hypothetical protein
MCPWKSCIISHFFFNEATVNGECYHAMLQGFLNPELWQLNLLDRTFFQQDGATCHHALNVQRTLNDIFPSMWIGRAGPIAWPPRLPDLTPLDHFLWGNIKTAMYSSKQCSLYKLKVRITNAIHEISTHQLRNVFNKVESWFEGCALKDGSYIKG